jgi:hypothetical protein
MHYHVICLKRLKKLRKVRLSNVAAEIRTEHPPNRSLEGYDCANPFGLAAWVRERDDYSQQWEGSVLFQTINDRSMFCLG